MNWRGQRIDEPPVEIVLSPDIEKIFRSFPDELSKAIDSIVKEYNKPRYYRAPGKFPATAYPRWINVGHFKIPWKQKTYYDGLGTVFIDQPSIPKEIQTEIRFYDTLEEVRKEIGFSGKYPNVITLITLDEHIKRFERPIERWYEWYRPRY